MGSSNVSGAMTWQKWQNGVPKWKSFDFESKMITVREDKYVRSEQDHHYRHANARTSSSFLSHWHLRKLLHGNLNVNTKLYKIWVQNIVIFSRCVKIYAIRNILMTRFVIFSRTSVWVYMGNDFHTLNLISQALPMTSRDFQLSRRRRCVGGQTVVLATLWFTLNDLIPGDTVTRHWSWTPFIPGMFCCLAAPFHYLNQCWLSMNLKENISVRICGNCCKAIYLKFIFSPFFKKN